jgi:single-stranded DNA-binding protein
MLPNVVFLVGKICRAELRSTKKGKSVLNARLAVSDGDSLAMVDLVFWSSIADRAQRLIRLDEEPRIAVQGSLRQDRWTSADGEPRTKLSVKVDRFYVLLDISKNDFEEGYFEQEE